MFTLKQFTRIEKSISRQGEGGKKKVEKLRSEKH